MATDHRKDSMELDRILDGITESMLEATEEEIDDDLRAAGDDPRAAADRLRTGLDSTMERHRFTRRARARGRIQQNVLLMNIHPWEFPESESERMRLLGAALRRRPELEEMLQTKLQALHSLTDEEVKDCLHQLAERGALDDVPECEE